MTMTPDDHHHRIDPAVSDLENLERTDVDGTADYSDPDTRSAVRLTGPRTDRRWSADPVRRP